MSGHHRPCGPAHRRPGRRPRHPTPGAMEPWHGPVSALRRGSAFLEQHGMTTGDLNVTAAELMADPSLIGDIAPDRVPELLIRVTSIAAALAARMPAQNHNARDDAPAIGDRLLDA